ncbi:MAG: FG-GAP repeat domain-containing protein [Gemmatimonadota bacterium]
MSDSSGSPYAYPWLGGFNQPRPQIQDIDGDGDQDLFIQESSGRVMFFENVGSPETASFEWRSGSFQGLEAGEWYRFADLDSDGDIDMLAEEIFSYIRYYRNEGSATDPRFVLADDSLRDSSGTPIFSDRQNIPNITDIDCDGRLDLLIGRLTGTITQYSEIDRTADGLPRFRHVTDRFQDIEIVAAFGPGAPLPGGNGVNPAGSLHGANTLALKDIDSDGDLDLFWGDFFEAGLLLIENEGTCSRPDLDGEPSQFPLNDPLLTSGYNAPALGDMDADGDLDLFVGVLGGAFNPNRTTIDNLYYLEQTTSDEFEVKSSRYLTSIDVGSESVPVFIDLDGDGDQDLLVGNKLEQAGRTTGRMYLFENTGSTTAPRFQLSGTMPFEGAYHFSPAFGDLDADGTEDMVLGNWTATLDVYWNRDGDFTADSSLSLRLTRGTNGAPALVDIDADGDLDLFVGEASGELNFYRNQGSATRPLFALESESYGAIDVGRRSVPRFVDMDRDGDQDMIIGSEIDGIQAYRNDGTTSEPAFTAVGTLPIAAPAYAVPAFVDIDGDGALELFVGGNGGGVLYFETPRD